jgi:hypothetical protein
MNHPSKKCDKNLKICFGNIRVKNWYQTQTSTISFLARTVSNGGQLKLKYGTIFLLGCYGLLYHLGFCCSLDYHVIMELSPVILSIVQDKFTLSLGNSTVGIRRNDKNDTKFVKTKIHSKLTSGHSNYFFDPKKMNFQKIKQRSPSAIL